MKALSSLFAISALALVPSLANAGSGVDVDVNTIYSIIGGSIDQNGDPQDLDEGLSASVMLIDLGVGYAVSDELSLKVSLPIVQRAAKFEAGGQTLLDQSTMGLGDASLAGRYMTELNDTASIGGELRFKMATGAEEVEATADAEGSYATGSGYHNIQAAVVASLAPVDNLNIDIDAGYIMTMAKTEEGLTINPGDAIYANTYFGYDISGITPRLGVHYFSAGVAQAGAEGGDLAEAADTDMNGLSLTADVSYALSDTMGIRAGLGSSLLPMGANLPWGMALSGKNVTTGMSFNLGFNAAF